MLLVSLHYDLEIHGDPADIWQPWLAHPIDHRIIDSGHHQAEEAPGPVTEALLDFFAL
jgi:haloacetate dehalogenase